MSAAVRGSANAKDKFGEHGLERITDAMLWECLTEAEARKEDSGLPIEVRLRSAKTVALCLREARSRGYDYVGLRDAVVLSAGSSSTS